MYLWWILWWGFGGCQNVFFVVIAVNFMLSHCFPIFPPLIFKGFAGGWKGFFPGSRGSFSLKTVELVELLSFQCKMLDDHPFVFFIYA